MTAFSPTSTQPSDLPVLIEGLPNICGWEDRVVEVMSSTAPVFLERTPVRLEQVQAAFAIALHMHQPTIPAGAQGELISNLQHMFEHPGEGDNHNAGPFAWCYGRMGEFIPKLVHSGRQPRVMLDYSGNLLWGLQQMTDSGRLGPELLDNLRRITTDPAYWPCVEWLGTMWSHTVVPSTPIPDLKLHIRAWQHHFASLFGWEALSRVRGFSPPEMHLPNHPDTLYEFVKALRDCGYRWLLVQEHSVEMLQGGPIDHKHLPHRLIARNSQGEEVSITALIKTQGSDTKLVGQMQPYYEAKTLARQELAGVEIPPLVSQIGDGENGGVMMNEFPSAFFQAWEQIGPEGVIGLNGGEYLELIEAAGCDPNQFPPCQAVGQHRIWAQLGDQPPTPERLEQAIEQLRQSDSNFHLDGASWTNDRSWVKGYENVLTPMNQLSALFHRKVQADTQEPRYRNALLYLLLSQTSCFRYWGQGIWTEYARELYRRGLAILEHDF
ncbi:glycosyl hydrolase family 57 [Leptolyngbya sp. FACHB-261]|uniref:glycosyl hydrolase family 57 n=1 Tax=Leptolyngbya sp. FACHB-261 TaxID=2692806 RepID=UPI001684388C|nr:glycosyl hydrolase family 57 [Leptolyngbya sp. FACHB-261]MBD2099808.1 glycosyl hydrolase family 57 [Leptolyngbya sp. FACHB-261]